MWRWGFNPCFDGWGSPTSIKSSQFLAAISFNPCFDGWGSPTLYKTGTCKVGTCVSILVLMDGARRPVIKVPPIRTSPGFNPCFDGWGSPTLSQWRTN